MKAGKLGQRQADFGWVVMDFEATIVRISERSIQNFQQGNPCLMVSDTIEDGVREAAAAAVANREEHARSVAVLVTLRSAADDGVQQSVFTHLVVPHCVRMRQWWR